ncbi:ABC transporter F family member 2-like [Dendrobium catenatum]|uniref:ABC transporter F family member 2-like n=1 Tax=Dendrobium catenatum TaxID=906689 RepID=UPI0010A0B3F8|nr:ABC transporter F family member 2-like [Dendrobium catenatum]
MVVDGRWPSPPLIGNATAVGGGDMKNKPVLGRSEINGNSSNSIDKNFHNNIKERVDPSKNDVGSRECITVAVIEKSFVNIEDNSKMSNLWSNKHYIKLNFKREDIVLSEDGKAVKLDESAEVLNAKRLENSLVFAEELIRMDGEENEILAMESRRDQDFHCSVIEEKKKDCGWVSSEQLEDGEINPNDEYDGMEKEVQARLAFCKFMVKPSTLSILDEPTNHLDIPSKEMLEEAISEYQGTVITVSHDRYFIRQIVNRRVEVKNNTLQDYAGDYNYYLEKNLEAREREVEREAELDAKAPKVKAKSKMSKEIKPKTDLTRISNPRAIVVLPETFQ